MRFENLDAKDALLEMASRGFFTIQHFNGGPVVLVALQEAWAADVRAAVIDAWRVMLAARKPVKKLRAKAATKSRNARRGTVAT